jgi:choline-phosphate cytidylyltransferase
LTRSFEVRYEDASRIDKYATKFLSYGLRYEISDFAYMINGNGGRGYKLTRGESIAMAGIMEKFLEQRKG